MKNVSGKQRWNLKDDFHYLNNVHVHVVKAALCSCSLW